MVGLFVEVEPRPEHNRYNNPYRAQIVAQDDSWSVGEVRVEPPIQIGEREVDLMESDVSVTLTTRLIGREATLLSFDVIGKHFLPNQERVVTTVKNLLDDLGFMASAENLKHMYQVPQQGE